MDIKVIGPRDRDKPASGIKVINTTSRTPDPWCRAFSPFYLGPIPLYGGQEALLMENAWQYAKVYPDQVGADGQPTRSYFDWARTGWADARAARYPRGKGAKPAYLWWDGEALDYVSARCRVYFPLYRDAVRKTVAFRHLQVLAHAGPVVLWDFDGYDHEGQGMSLRDVFLNPLRSMGHAFVLKAMLLYGPDVTLEDLPDVSVSAPPPPQLDMF